MKYLRCLLLMLFAASLFTGCCRSRDELWDDTKSASRHMGRGLKSLGGKHGDSRQVCHREDFVSYSDNIDQYDWAAMDFIPLQDESNPRQIAMADAYVSKAKEPGDPRGRIPGIEGFRDPKDDPSLKSVFKTIHYPYNSSLIKGKENMDIAIAAAGYLKSHPNTYVFIEGHCDQRGAEAYNLALGAKRAASLRNFLIENGASPEHIFTVSYGKERPIDPANNETAWTKNRRAEFKIYNR